MNVIQRLIAIQHSLGLRDDQFAEKLGISKTLWILTKSGKRSVRFEILSGAAAAFPESTAMQSDILEFLRASGGEPAAAPVSA